MVKNEASRIVRCLHSLVPFVDSFVICDTGSTDGTQDVISNFLTGRNAKFKILSTEFKTWEQARNDAYRLAIENANGSDYIMLVDADMELVVEQGYTFDDLTADAYMVRQDSPFLSYHNVRLVKANTVVQYRGVTHEYLEVKGKVDFLTKCHFKDHTDGSNRKNKFERDIMLLKGGLEDGLSARYMFYLANSYRDSGKNEEALKWYEARMDLGGWEDEVWMSIYYAGMCCLTLNREAEFLKWMMMAAARNPKRAEPFSVLAEHFRKKEAMDLGYMFAKKASEIPVPKNGLFINHPMYTYTPLFEMSVSGFYNEKNRSEAREACFRLITMQGVPQNITELSRRNAVYYLQKATDVFPGATIEYRDFGVGEGVFGEHNPSICKNPSGGYDMIVRSSNYCWKQTGQMVCEVMDDTDTVFSKSYLVHMDDSLQIKSVSLLTMYGVPTPPFESRVASYEDLRIFRCRGELFASAMSHRHHPTLARQVLMRIREDGAVTSISLLEPGTDVHEKNWMPIVGMDNPTLLYKCSPTKVVEVDDAGHISVVRSSVPSIDMSNWNGGSEVMPHDGGWIFVVHESVAFVDKPRVYWHRFVWMDNDFVIRKYTNPFVFTKIGIEYCAGLTRRGQSFLLTFGIDDRKAAFCEIPKESLNNRWFLVEEGK